MANYLIRVGLPDRPGALGAVASRIGSVGADVISIDILQREGGVVVDELGVRLAGGHLLDLLRDEILEVDGVTIESVREVDGALPDLYGELLEMVGGLLGRTTSADLLGQLVTRVRDSLDADFAAALARGGDGPVAASGDLPDAHELAALANGGGAVPQIEGPFSNGQGGVGPEVSVMSVGMADAGLVLVVGRAHPVLRERERRWVTVMADLADSGWRALV